MQPPRELTEAEVLRGKLLSPETCDLLRYEVALLTNRLCEIVFPADPVQRETSILEYVETQAKRASLIELLNGSSEAFDYLSQLETNASRN